VKQRPQRARRSADDAKRLILDAAERRLEAVGPAGLRLQDVAAEVGISHPAVLHHFGSREGLVRAVVARAVATLHADLVKAISAVAADEQGPPDGSVLFELVAEMLGARGHARLLAWLLLSGYDPFDSEEARAGWKAVAQTTHELRLARTRRKEKPSYEDTLFTIVLSALALFGQAIAGPSTFEVAGLGRGAAVERRFRTWIAALLSKHMARS
jgi:AcrR family transcriptional regulator